MRLLHPERQTNTGQSIRYHDSRQESGINIDNIKCREDEIWEVGEIPRAKGETREDVENTKVIPMIIGVLGTLKPLK